jgi:hypothetical protein
MFMFKEEPMFATAGLSRRMESTLRLAYVICIALALIFETGVPHRLFGQSATASLTGLVQDSSGAIIPEATVTVTNVATNEVRTAKSNSQGYYLFPVLPPAVYRLTVQFQGFKQFVQENLHMDVDLALSVNVKLEVGGESQSIVVSDMPPPLETESSELGQVIDNQQITDLPTNGRNSYSFAALIPGVLAPAGFTSTAFDEYSDQFVSINGARPNQNVFLLDGGMNSEPAFNGPGYFPSIDLVQEYKVQTNNFGAEFSNAAGGVVNVITKSGTNKIHGSAYWFNRNDDLEANNFFAIRDGIPRAVFLFNQFGGTVGGPIYRNRTFFFGNYEGFRQVAPSLYVTTVPTALQRTGDFSQTFDPAGNLIPIYNPFSTTPDPANPSGYIRTQFPGNVIPPGLINPVANTLTAYYPLPNTQGIGPGGVNNFTSDNSDINIKNEGSLRIDQSFSETKKLYGRFSEARSSQPYADLLGTSPNELLANILPTSDQYVQMQTTADFTDAITPSLLLDLNTSFIRYTIVRNWAGENYNPTQLGFPSYFNALAAQYPPCFPTVNITGETGIGPGGCYILRDAYQIYYDYGNVTKQFSKNTLKAGADIALGTLGTARYTPSGGTYDFGTNFTQGPDPTFDTNAGYGFASFLLGTPAAGGTGIGPGPDQILHYKYFGGYVQNDWKVTRKLTLNLGGRYDINTPFVERFNRMADFNPTAVSPLNGIGGLNLVGGMEYPGVNGVPSTLFNRDSWWRGFVPRLGFAYSVFPTTVIRGGFGMFLGPITGGGFNGAAVPNTGFLATTSMVTTLNGVTPDNVLSNPFPQGFVLPTGSSLGLSTSLGQGVTGADRDRPTPYTEEGNLDLQQSFPHHFLFDIAYAWSHGVHLVGDYNANSLPDSDLGLGNALLGQVANPFFGTILNGPLSGPTVAQEQLLLPYPQFAGVTLGGVSFFGASSYNAMQVKLEKRYASDFSLLVAYTWSKLMDNVLSTESGFPGGNFFEPTPQDWHNLKSYRSLADFDIPQMLSVSASYDLPFGHGKRFLTNNRIADELVGGWQLNTIITAQSGTPYTILVANNELFNGASFQFANYNGQGVNNPGPFKNRLNDAIKVSNFSAPGPFTYGNMPRIYGGLRADGLQNTNLSGIKNLKLYREVNAEFRAEAFNLFNHPQFNYPDFYLGDGTTGIISSTSNSARQIQLAVKFTF